MTITKPFAWPTPRSAYVHVPFCRHRCGYCNFSVVADRDDLVNRYLSAIDHELAALDRPEVDTLFIGGGTPTHFDGPNLGRFLETMKQRFRLAENYEWSIEANPEDISDETLDRVAAAGVNRISLGVQSFGEQKLRVLERGHSGDQAKAVIEKVSSVIENVSIDLIFAAPGESVDQWRTDLQTALALPIQHLSTYALTYEKGTQFWTRRLRGDLTSASEQAEVEMYELARELTSEAGLSHYEISSFARQGRRCRHNMAYWQGRGWFAAGPSAANFVGGKRETNHRSTTTYLKRVEAGQSPIAESDVVDHVQYTRERVAFGIRMIDGIDIDEIERETGVDIGALCRDEIEDCLSKELIERHAGGLRLTRSGVLFADYVARELLG